MTNVPSKVGLNETRFSITTLTIELPSPPQKKKKHKMEGRKEQKKNKTHIGKYLNKRNYRNNNSLNLFYNHNLITTFDKMIKKININIK